MEDKKMTSGEIAKKAGVSQKAVRLYDEKGLLKPTEYSEGNYRLYDKEALQVLEKIVALKQIGFSLEEIRDNLVAGDAVDIEEALRIQLKTMEEKRWQIEKVITSINRTLERKGKDLDWDDVASIVQNVSIDLKADEGHWDAVLHTSEDLDWYVKIFRALEIKENEKVLDLGCGFSKLWRNNWKDIPKGTKVYAYDLHGSWADDFANFLKENKAELPEGVDINITFEDLEKAETWDIIEKDKDYSLIIAHYIRDELKNVEAFVARASEVLAKGGKFSFNNPCETCWDKYFKKTFEDMGVKAPFFDDVINELDIEKEVLVVILKKYFPIIKSVYLPCRWVYTTPDEMIDKLKRLYPEQEKFILSEQRRIKEYYAEKIAQDGEIVIDVESEFWQCGK